MIRVLAIAGALVLAGCGTLGRYTGDEYYYTQDGVHWSCREPMPYKGGTCMPEALWGSRK